MESLTIKNRQSELEVMSPDQDNEIGIFISSKENEIGHWLNPSDANELITHLCKCLRLVGEPIMEIEIPSKLISNH